MPIGKRMDFVVLDVLQGLGTFVAFYDDNDVLVDSMLLDLGTEKFRKDDPFPSVDKVALTLRTMQPRPVISAIILSHSDTDHISLLSLLLGKFKPYSPLLPAADTLEVKYCRIGGEYGNYKKRGTNVLDTLKKYFPQDGGTHLFSSAASETSFPRKQTEHYHWTPIVKVRDASVYILAANTVVSQASVEGGKVTDKKKVPHSYAMNVVSIVSIVDYRESQLVVTGDATGLTLAMCNAVMTASDVGLDLLLDDFMVTAPHHGSEATTYDLQGMRTLQHSEAELAERSLAEFVRHMGARTLSASAGMVKKFRHPSARVVQAFWPQLGTALYQDPVLPEGMHLYTAYFTASQYQMNVPNLPPLTGSVQAAWPGSSNWWSAQTDKNIFTNLYFLAGSQGEASLPPAPGSRVAAIGSGPTAPPLGANWTFRVPKTLGEKRSVIRDDNRVTPLAVRAAALGMRLPAPGVLAAAGAGPAGAPRAFPAAEAARPAPAPGAPASPRGPGAAPAGLSGLRVIP